MCFNAERPNKIRPSILEIQQGNVQKVSVAKEINYSLGL
jgi:hypothetical protein